jgi:hypothetical protein
MRAVTGNSFRGGDTSPPFQARYRSAVLPSVLTVPPREGWGTTADVAWEKDEVRE